MPRPRPRRPVCGNCGAVSVFSWTGGAHHCVVAQPQQSVDDTPLRGRTAAPVPPPPALDSEAGLSEHIGRINSDRAPIHRDVISFDGVDAGHRITVAMQWTSSRASTITTVPTDDASTHRDGFLDAVTTVVNGFARRQRRITGDGPDLTRADIGAGLTAIVSVRACDPDAGAAGCAVTRVCTEHLTHWLTGDQVTATTIVHKAISAHLMRRGAACRG